jgi:uncharacterized MAPEG superfamily protein
MSPNYPLLSIPAYYVFSIIPHIYASSILAGAGYKTNNANPKASLSPDNVKGKVPDAVYVFPSISVPRSLRINVKRSFQKYQRAENAQSNNIEQMPLFAVAVLASIIAERTTAAGLSGGKETGVTTFIGVWFALRAMYGVAYVQIADHSTSFVRSLLYTAGSGLAVWQIWKAAVMLG